MSDKPSEIHSVRKLANDFEQFSKLKKALPILRPFLRSAGVDVSKLEKTMADLARQQVEFDALVTVMDRFNEVFASRGWIAYDLLEVEVARAAIAAADAGNMVEAEEILIRHYTPDRVKFELRTLTGLSSFRPRMRLAELALIDYREGRYHACVPVVLALLDGMVNELSNQGFFSKAVDMSAWDSIAACSSGLRVLQRLLFRSRSTTTDTRIEVPYRNGIHHGMDLGYDSQLVAAKCWAALFGTADWARRFEQGNRQAPPAEPELDWQDVLQILEKNAECKARLEAWRPRELQSLPHPAIGDPDSPEAALVEFLQAWKDRKYGVMAKRTHPFSRLGVNARAGEVRNYYEGIPLHDFTIDTIRDTAPAAAIITVKGRGVQHGKPFDAEAAFQLMHLDNEQLFPIDGSSAGTWFIMSWNPWAPNAKADPGQE